MMAIVERFGTVFTPDLVKACLVLTLIAAAVVIALFAYVARGGERGHYRLWTIGWLFYSVFIAAMIAQDTAWEYWQIATIPTACVGLSALFMFAGNLHVLERPMEPRTLFLNSLAILTINHFAHGEGYPYWFACPAYWALAAAAIHAGLIFYRNRCSAPGGVMVVVGFWMWALQVIAVPLVERQPLLFGMSQFLASACLVLVALGVIVDNHLEHSELKYRTVMDGTSDAIFMVDLWTLKVLDANQAAHRFARRPMETLIGTSFAELCPDLRDVGANILDHRKMFAEVFRPFHEFHFLRSDGALVLCEGDTSVSQWRDRAVLQVRLREINPDNNVGQLVRRAEKMQSLGQLIAGVAHELNNPLAVVVGYAQIMARQPIADETVRSNCQRLLHEADRASKIVRDLLAFSRPGQPQLAPVNFNELVSGVLDVRQRDLDNAGVELHQHLQPGLSLTKADALQIEQVINNLITNALHAMAQQPQPRRLTVTTLEAGRYIRISIADSGCGIAPDLLQKIFEPFFTTKAPGKGTGLGLSISHNILAEHHGRIWAESAPGRGATFHLELPVVPCEAEAPVAVTAEEKIERVFANQTRRLLVVDDEPGIRDVLGAILGECGYVVDCVGNGIEALERMKANPYDLVITDMCMPEMDGEKLYECVRDTNPQLARRMIFVTGDTVSAKSRAFLERTRCRWLSKPFNIRDVEIAVERFLSEHLPVTGATAQVVLHHSLG
jgi:two-component system NtrC family sensor kinase